MVTLNLTRLVLHCLIAGATLQCCLLLTWHSVPQTLVGRAEGEGRPQWRCLETRKQPSCSYLFTEPEQTVLSYCLPPPAHAPSLSP